MVSVILILIMIALTAAAILVPIIAKILIRLDYVFLVALIWVFVFGFGASGQDPDAWLANHEIHTVFVILIYLAALGAWFGLQQIRVFNIYIFRIIACMLSASILTYLAVSGLFGQAIADGMNVIWQWIVGILYFIVVAGLRMRDKSLIVKERDTMRYNHQL